MITVLEMIHNAITLFFGIFISAFFLGVKKTHKNILILLLCYCVIGGFYGSCYMMTGEDVATHLYPFLVHIPLIVFLTIYYHYRIICVAVSVFSTYLCCQISNWIGLVALDVTDALEVYYIVRILTTVIVFYILGFRMCHTMETILGKDSREVFMIGVLPFVYYVFDYASTKYSSALYSGNKAIAEFMSFAFCFSYLIFLLFYVREYEKKMEIRQYSNLMELQLQSIHNEVEYVDYSKKKLSIMKHDMRHHIHVIQTFLLENEQERAMEYMQEVDSAYEETRVDQYCRNALVNSVISVYETRFEDRGFQLKCSIYTDEILPCPDINLCVILSNALENAMHALENLSSVNRWTELNLSVKGQLLLLEVKNPIESMPQFVDGIPISVRDGHGIGVRSIIYYVEQMKGQYQFAVSDHKFVLRIIIGGTL